MSSFGGTANAIRRLLFDVAVHDLRRIATLLERLFDRFRKHHRAMFSPGASEGNGQIALALANVMRNQIGQQAVDAAQKFAGLREGADVSADFWVRAVVRAQSRIKMR